MARLAAVQLIASPNPLWLTFAVIAALVAHLLWRSAQHRLTPPVPIEIGDRRPGPDAEPPAVVGLITNGYRVPRSAVTATVIDLARRGWIRMAQSDDGELVVLTRSASIHGDALRPAEQMVLNHLTANSFDGATSSSILTDVRQRLSPLWFRRFNRSVADDARARGLTRRGGSPQAVIPPTVVAIAALIAAWRAVTEGTSTSVRDSWPSLTVVAAATLAAGIVVWRAAEMVWSPAERPTEAGERRAGQWIGYRSRLAAAIPAHVSVLASTDQQASLAHGVVLGLAPQVIDEIGICSDDHRSAWSEAGGLARVVRIARPRRPGYGHHPIAVLGVGGAVLVLAQLLQRRLHTVRDGALLSEAVTSVPDVTGFVEDVAHVVGTALWIPSAVGIWAVAAGAIDLIWVRQLHGPIVKVRRSEPPRLVPARFRRDRLHLDMTLDEGVSPRVNSLVATERTAVPEGVWARVTATRLLGHVRAVRSAGYGS